MAESKITYLLKLDTSGAVQEVDKLTKSFDQLDKEQQKFAKNAKEVSLSKLKESLKDLESLKDSLQKAGTTATLFNKSLTDATQKLFERLQTTEAPKLINFLENQITLTKELAKVQRDLLNAKIATQNAKYAPPLPEPPSFKKGIAQAEANALKQQAARVPTSGVIGTATSLAIAAPFTSQAAQQASQNYNAAAKAAAIYQAQTQQAQTSTVLLNLAIEQFNLQIAKLVNSFAKTKEAFDVYRKGITSSQRATLDLAESIKYEIGLRERQKQAYANLNPELKKVTKARQDAAFFEQEIARAKKAYDESISTAKTAQEVLNLKNTFQQTFAVLEAGYKKAIADGKAAEQNFMAQVAAVEQLKKASLASIDRNQANFASSGRFAYLQGTGASTQEVQMQKLRDTIAKTEAAYAKLVSRTKEKLGATDDPTKIAKITQHYDRWSAKLSEINNKNQTLLGNVEKLAGAHKPLLERIFDLVVGYRLINSAVNTFTNALRSVPNMGLQYETTYATLKATFSVTAKVNEELKFLDQLAQDAGISIDSLRTSFVDFAASAKFSGEKVENINEIFANISKAGMVLHLPADKMKSAFTALNQMYAKNQVMMEELKRQLGNQLPAAVNIFALSMGKTTRQLMDDMKKGLVVPKETILNFSRTYAAIFADPASMAYASQGVNAHIQRLSTAWTNFATKIYEESKGLIKGGLSIATEAIDTLANHMTLLKNVATVTMTIMGVGLVTQLGRATLAMMATRNAAVAAAGAMSALTGVSATAGGVSALSTIGTYFKNIFLSIPSWVKLVAILGTAVMALKDLEVSSVKVMSSFDKLDGKAVEVQKSITVSDVAIASWHNLLDAAQTYWDKYEEWASKNRETNPKLAKLVGETKPISFMDVMEGQLQAFPATKGISTAARMLYNANIARAKQEKLAQNDADEAARKTEALNEKIKETLLAGTSGTVDETLAGVNKVVTTALGRIDQEFNLATSKIKSKTDLATAKLTGEIAKTALLEKQGAITAETSGKRQLELQKQINKLKREAIEAEIKALEDRIKKEEAISQAQIDKSGEATAYQEAYKNLGIKQKFSQEIPQSLVDIGAYKSVAEAAKALKDRETSKLADTTIQQAIDQYNATHLEHGFKRIEDVSEEAMKQANENTVASWKIYEAKMDAHATILNRVSEGVIQTNQIAEEEKKLFEQLIEMLKEPAPADTSSIMTDQVPFDVSAMKFETPKVTPVFVSSGLSPKVQASLEQGYANTDKYDNLIRMFSNQYGIDPKLAKTIMAVESKGYEKDASGRPLRSSAGAAGLMQLMPDTAKGLGVKNVDDAVQNIEGGIKLLAQLSKQFNGDVALIAAGYNAGANAVIRRGNKVPPYSETQDYVKKVKALYQPSTSSIKSGEVKSEDATRESIIKLQEKQAELTLTTTTQRNEEYIKAQELELDALNRVSEALQNTLNLTKTTQESELAKLQTSAVPLTETQLAAQTAAIKTKFAPELTKQIDAVIANTQEKLGRTIQEGTKQGLRAEIVNLEKERAAIQAEALQAKATVAINKAIPLPTALERKQFEIQKSLEDSLGLFNEQTFKLNQQIGQEETLKLLATENERLKDKSNGLTQKEIDKNTKLIALTEKQLAQLNQIELIKAKIARDRDLSASTRELADAQATNLPLSRASRMGVSGGFVGALVAEEAANYKYAEKMASYQQDIVNFKAEQNLEKDTAKWNKLQTQIEQTTSAMYDLSLAKDAVLNQAVADTMESISGHFVAWANGAEKAKDAFRGIAIDFAKMIQEIIMNELKMLAVKGIMSLITGGFSGGGSVGSLAGLGSTGATSAVGLFGFASGGQVSGKGTGTSDSIPAIVPTGSYVLNAKATSKAKRNRLINLSHGEVVFSPEQVAQLGIDNLDRMNKTNFASGGLVGGTTTSTSAKAAKQNSNVYNINVAVPEGTSNAKQFGNEVGLEIMKAVAREEAKKQVNQYNKLKARG